MKIPAAALVVAVAALVGSGCGVRRPRRRRQRVSRARWRRSARPSWPRPRAATTNPCGPRSSRRSFSPTSGTLYQWPIYEPNSDAGDLSAGDRKLFPTIMSEDEVEGLIPSEYGYTAPRLGILADGTWWFFILNRGA